MVPTMFSFAIRPVMEATVACQVPNPSGAKIQAITLPTLARMDISSSSSSSIRKTPSTVPKRLRNHTRIVDSRMMVPAFLIKLQPRSHMDRSTLPSVGQ